MVLPDIGHIPQSLLNDAIAQDIGTGSFIVGTRSESAGSGHDDLSYADGHEENGKHSQYHSHIHGGLRRRRDSIGSDTGSETHLGGLGILPDGLGDEGI